MYQLSLFLGTLTIDTQKGQLVHKTDNWYTKRTIDTQNRQSGHPDGRAFQSNLAHFFYRVEAIYNFKLSKKHYIFIKSTLDTL